MTYSINVIAILLFFAVSSIMSTETEYKGDTSEVSANESYSVLLFTKTEGWRHDSIEAGVEAIYQLGNENGFSVTWTEDSGYFTTENLSEYEAVIFLNTTLNLFNADQRAAFRGYIQNGGGFVGIHSATDTEYDWPWYGELVGAYFDNHPNRPNVREAVIEVVDSNHPSTRHLPDRWVRSDEWYNFGYMNEDVHVLLRLDTDSYEGSDHPGNHPIAWYHEFDGGRSFYTGLGHTIESFSEPLFLDHLLGGIQYAMDFKSKENE
jgi:type 1 glutamine amidotransferase